MQNLQDLDLRQVKSFVVVAECASLTKAADILHISQSALSRQIQSLEAALGIALFDRIGRRLALTANGERLLGSADQLIEHANAMFRNAAGAGNSRAGLIRVGATHQTIANVIAPTLTAFSRIAPDVEVALREGSNAELIEMVRAGTLHAAIAAVPDWHELEAEDLYTSHLYAVTPPGDPRRSLKAIPLDALKGDRLLLLRKGYMTRDLFEQACLRKRIRPRVLLETSSVDPLIELTNRGHGVAVLSSSAVTRRKVPGAIPLEVNRQFISQKVSIVSNPSVYRPSVLTTFIDLAKKQTERFGADDLNLTARRKKG